ncbi:MAG: polysulfide reductase NrfD [Gemmatimonadota bacterium]|nr:polysulfide reductase NrfD [Gemmatimonadota bacterium]MDH5804288.1 polysulfide reductase NrfD [Gemmatimonadota bacterium]
MAGLVAADRDNQMKWGKVLDATRCIGCHACTTACKSENDVPVGVTRTYVKYVDVGTFPQVRRAMQVTRCNQCEDPPCVAICPTAAMHQRPDGIVDFDKNRCIGCKSCILACPYDAIFINPDNGTAEKCNFCAHRLDVGLEPACVVVCPTQAIRIGDLNDPDSSVAQTVNRSPVAVRRPEKNTRPKVFYEGAHQATLDPLAATRPDGDMFMWSEQQTGPKSVVSGQYGDSNTSASAMLAYDVQHKIPWDWRVSLYTWTKGIASGVYLVPILMGILFGFDMAETNLWRWAVPVLGGAFLAMTGMLLIWDLDRPDRFYFLFTKAQPGSWLVRGGIIIGLYTLVLVAHFAGSVLEQESWSAILKPVGVAAAILTAIYTAYLFGQARGRDLWQNPLLPPHLLVQSIMVGSAALTIAAVFFDPEFVGTLLNLTAIASAAHLLLVGGEVSISHPTAHAAAANSAMVRGRYARFFWTGAIVTVIAIFSPWIGPVGAVAALVGLLAHEHAYVQAAQSIPLA